MSFGTLNLFNFYQQPNTGRIPARGTYDFSSVVETGIRAGATSDRNWPFPYVGTRIPYEIYEGGGAAYQIRLLSDSDVGAVDGKSVGLRIGTVFTVLSGKFEGDKELGKCFTTLSGNFYPRALDTGNSEIKISGSFTGAPSDYSSQRIILSGVLTGIVPDSSIAKLVLSGSLIQGNPEAPALRCFISGSITDGNIEKSQITVRLSGAFTPTIKDICNVQYEMVDFLHAYNRIIHEINTEDSFMLTYGLRSFFSSRP